MNYSGTLFLNGGLFDFDFTFVGEGILFLLFSLVVTFVFLIPISKQLDDRAEFIDFNLRKSSLLVFFGETKFLNSMDLLVSQVSELKRQLKLTKIFVETNFEQEIDFVQKENSKLLKKLKGELSIKSASLFSNLTDDFIKLTDKFFVKKFQETS